MTETYIRGIESIHAPEVVYENSRDRNSLEPVGCFTIVIVVANRTRLIKVVAATPLQALQVFKKLYFDTYKNGAIREIL